MALTERDRQAIDAIDFSVRRPKLTEDEARALDGQDFPIESVYFQVRAQGRHFGTCAATGNETGRMLAAQMAAALVKGIESGAVIRDLRDLFRAAVKVAYIDTRAQNQADLYAERHEIDADDWRERVTAACSLHGGGNYR